MTDNNNTKRRKKSPRPEKKAKPPLTSEQTFDDASPDTRKVKPDRQEDSSPDANHVEQSSADKRVFKGTPTAPITESRIKEIGKYQVENIIGKGGMGTVYKAFDPYIERYVAIKMMTETQYDEATTIKRFFREAKAIGQLQHPHIITIHDTGEYRNCPYLVVEFLEGHDLQELADQDLLPPSSQLLSMMIRICDALEYAHQQGIIHRDIKPANIFLTHQGDVKLMDFGIAKVAATTITKKGMLVGTLQYMSPEQLNGQALDRRTDIYSLGVVIFELFSQELPYEGETITQLIRNILLFEPQKFGPTDPDLPELLSRVVAKALDKDIKKRYRSASALGADLKKCKSLYDQKIRADQNGLEKRAVATEKRQEWSTVPVHNERGWDTVSATEKHATAHVENTAQKVLDQVQTKQRGPHYEVVGKSKKVKGIYFISLILGLVLLVFFGIYRHLFLGAYVPTERAPIETPVPTRTNKTHAKKPQESLQYLETEFRKDIENEWLFARELNTKESYQKFIAQFSQESLAVEELELAQMRLIEFEEQEKKAALKNKRRKVIQTQWQKVAIQNTIQAYTDFLQHYQNDQLAAPEVKQALKNLSTLKHISKSKLFSLIKTGPDMVNIIGGHFEMGDLFGDGDLDETPHSVAVSSFTISKCEVTFAEFDTFCESKGRRKPSASGFGRSLQPVINVSWYDAIEYCNWLSVSKGLTPCYAIDKTRADPFNKCPDDHLKWAVFCNFTANGYRLPTEAEWEFAARQRGQKVMFSHGQMTADPKEINYNHSAGPLPVGTLSANSLQLYDMSGNVWEWCWNWYAPYEPSTSQSPTSAQSGEAHVIRGGSWKNTSATFVRASNRLYAAPQSSDVDLGFRVVRTGKQ